MLIKNNYERMASSPSVRSFFIEKRAVGDMPSELAEAVQIELKDMSPLYRAIDVAEIGGGSTRITMHTVSMIEDPDAAWLECGARSLELVPSDGNLSVHIAGEISGWSFCAVGILCNAVLNEFSPATLSFYAKSVAHAVVPALDHAILFGDGVMKPAGIMNELPEDMKKTTAKTGDELFADLIDFAVLAENGVVANVDDFHAIINRKTAMKLLQAIRSTETQSPAYLPRILAKITLSNEMADGEMLLGFPKAYLLLVRKKLEADASGHVKFIEDHTAVRVRGMYDGLRMSDKAFVHVTMTGI